jgi:uncharacterized membrane protein
MTREEFCEGLRQELDGLPQREIDQTIHYYTEIIADRMEEGMTEEQAVAVMEPMHVIARRMKADFRPNTPPRRGIGGWQIALIILGFPVWFPLLVVGAVLTVTAFALVWVLVLCLWAVCLALFVWGVAVILSLILGGGSTALPLGQIGAGMAAMGLSIFVFYGARGAMHPALHMTGRLAGSVWKRLVGRNVA